MAKWSLSLPRSCGPRSIYDVIGTFPNTFSCNRKNTYLMEKETLGKEPEILDPQKESPWVLKVESPRRPSGKFTTTPDRSTPLAPKSRPKVAHVGSYGVIGGSD